MARSNVEIVEALGLAARVAYQAIDTSERALWSAEDQLEQLTKLQRQVAATTRRLQAARQQLKTSMADLNAIAHTSVELLTSLHGGGRVESPERPDPASGAAPPFNRSRN